MQSLQPLDFLFCITWPELMGHIVEISEADFCYQAETKIDNFLWTTSQMLPHTLSDSKVHVAHMGPTWVLSDPGGPHVGPNEPCYLGCCNTWCTGQSLWSVFHKLLSV